MLQEGGTYGEIAWSAEEVNDTSRSQPSSHMCYKKKSSIKGAIPDFYKVGPVRAVSASLGDCI